MNRVAAGGRPAAVLVLAAILALEAVGIVAATVLGVTGAPVTPAAVAIVVLAVVVAVLLIGTAVALLGGRPWTRAATFTWQIVQLLVGLYAFQPPGARPDLGTLTVAPAAVALLLLLFSRGVRAWTARV